MNNVNLNQTQKVFMNAQHEIDALYAKLYNDLKDEEHGRAVLSRLDEAMKSASKVVIGIDEMMDENAIV